MSRFTRDQIQKENIMSSYKNNVHLEGNLGKDAEKKSTPNGDVVNFSIAVNEQWEDKDGAEHKNTDWFQIQVWGHWRSPPPRSGRGRRSLLKARSSPRRTRLMARSTRLFR